MKLLLFIVVLLLFWKYLLVIHWLCWISGVIGYRKIWAKNISYRDYRGREHTVMRVLRPRKKL